MGKAAKWFKSLLSSKKEIKEARERDLSQNIEKKRWSFKSSRESSEMTTSSNENNAAWLKSINMYSESENEQSKHAIAVAAATAAVADAAVAAAQAAVAVVRLTSQGRSSMFGGVHERNFAAVKIQTVFRAYLAKKALRALKALVKLQALVRGYLVRKQAAATLHSMQALIRAQATIRAHKSRGSNSSDRRFLPEICPINSIEKFDESRSEYMSSIHSRRLSGNLDNSMYDKSPKIVEIDTHRPKSRSARPKISPVYIDPTDELSDYDWCRYSCTAQSTPRYLNNAPPTPSKSINGDIRKCVNLHNYPNYMSNTQSFEAKVRSQSAPKQRPELPGQKKRVPLSEVLAESRASLSGIGMQRSCVRAQESAGLNLNLNYNRSFEFGREMERDFYLQRKW